MTDAEIKTNLSYYSAYFDALFFADINDDSEGYNDDLTVHSINKDCLIKAFKDLDAFFEEAGSILDSTDYDHDQACHDFYFTRNRHGVGFWENDHCSKEQGRELTELAHKYGETYVSIHGDTIYLG